jgi:hypothetical protein
VRYLLLLCGDEAAAQRAVDGSVMAGCGDWTEEMRRRGVLRAVEGLRPPGDATTVRVRDDQLLLSDGPFAETKEQIGGYCLIECADLHEAIEVAASWPACWSGCCPTSPRRPACWR